MDAGEVGARDRGAADRGARPVDEVDDPVGQAGRLQQSHVVVGRECGGRRRLPDDRASHERRRRGEVPADAAEVEGADREDEALEWPVLQAVPDPGRRVRLLRVDAQHEVDVVAPEVDHLAHGVDLGLVRGLRLVQHRGRVQRGAPWPGEELGRAEEHRRALVPRHPRPVGVRRVGGGDRLLDMLGASLGDVGEDVALAVRHDRLEGLVRVDVLAADDHRNRDALACIDWSRACSSARSGVPGA